MTKIPTSARSIAGETAYQEAKRAGQTVPLDQEDKIMEFDHWYIINNRFPYDMTFGKHHMLVPFSGAAFRADLSIDELNELDQIILQLDATYDLVFENFTKRRSVLSLFHLHLASYYTNRKDMRL